MIREEFRKWCNNVSPGERENKQVSFFCARIGLRPFELFVIYRFTGVQKATIFEGSDTFATYFEKNEKKETDFSVVSCADFFHLWKLLCCGSSSCKFTCEPYLHVFCLVRLYWKLRAPCRSCRMKQQVRFCLVFFFCCSGLTIIDVAIVSRGS